MLFSPKDQLSINKWPPQWSHTGQRSQLCDSPVANTTPQVKIWVQLPRGRAKCSVDVVTTAAPDDKKRSQPVGEQRYDNQSFGKN